MDLVKAARKGEEEAAFLHLFEEHHLPLFRFAYRLTGSVADAEDIVQECFLSLLRRECTYDPKRTPVRTYLFGIVRNQSVKRLRKSDFGVGATPPQSPESEVLRNEMEDAVARAVTELPEPRERFWYWRTTSRCRWARSRRYWAWNWARLSPAYNVPAPV